MEIKEIKKWFELAIPEPTDKSRVVQIGCHLEEVAEMTGALARGKDSLTEMLNESANDCKKASDEEIAYFSSIIGEIDRIELLDSLCDQIVTAIGVAHMFGFDIEGALKEVNRSNFSKFVDGKTVFNQQGKIAKPDSYSPPQLEQFIGK